MCNTSQTSKIHVLVIALLLVGAIQANGQQNSYSGDPMDTRSHRLIDYRRMFRCGRTPTAEELVGHWRGVNKGIVELVGYKQFIKEIKLTSCGLFGDNIQVVQVDQGVVFSCGWVPKAGDGADGLDRKGKFSVEPPRGVGAFRHGIVFSYRNGGNHRSDPANLLVDKVVMLESGHLLGRATAKFGLVHIPVAYFVLERM